MYTETEIKNYIENDLVWSRRSEDEFWKYGYIAQNLEIGKSLKEWAIFYRKKIVDGNIYEAKTLKSIPYDLVEDLPYILDEYGLVLGEFEIKEVSNGGIDIAEFANPDIILSIYESI
jgi:hypothetical protein